LDVQSSDIHDKMYDNFSNQNATLATIDKIKMFKKISNIKEVNQPKG
jgi:hypothetical protein